MPRILMVASEATPFAKTGGLADVIGALPAALHAAGEEVAVVLPWYRGTKLPCSPREVYRGLRISSGPHNYTADIFETVERGVTFYLVSCPPLYDRPGLYGENSKDYPDNHIRFGVFCRAALDVIRHLFRPDILHCHDWQSALAPLYMRHTYAGDPTFLGIRILFTIHNLGYQGLFPAEALSDIGLGPDIFLPNVLEFFGRINLLLGAMYFSDAISTVSKGYAREIQTPEFGFGLDPFLRARADRLTGIVNGVDYVEWSPETDGNIARNYSAENLSGKAVCKRALLEQLGLPAEAATKPVIGMVSRFVNQKGFDLVAEVAPELLREDIVLAVLGSGEPAFEKLFHDLAVSNPERVGVFIGYDNVLAHRIEAGSDMFLMPSYYEPCGLNQIYSLRYGTLPVVRAVGGLDDTIDETVGFRFHDYSGPALLACVRQALAAWQDKKQWQAMMKRAMKKDFSWSHAALDYAAVYRKMVRGAAIAA